MNSCKRWLINKAIATKLHNLEQSGELIHSCYDSIVFSKFKAMLGGNVRLMTTASAPINLDVLKCLKVCFSCEILEGYGMTETCGGFTGTVVGETTYGHVGGPNAGVKLRLKDVPDMNYYHTNYPPQGEIIVQAP